MANLALRVRFLVLILILRHLMGLGLDLGLGPGPGIIITRLVHHRAWVGEKGLVVGFQRWLRGLGVGVVLVRVSIDNWGRGRMGMIDEHGHGHGHGHYCERGPGRTIQRTLLFFLFFFYFPSYLIPRIFLLILDPYPHHSYLLCSAFGFSYLALAARSVSFISFFLLGRNGIEWSGAFNLKFLFDSSV